MTTTSSPNSLTPTSTLYTGSSAPTNYLDGNGGGITGLFSATESPSLIVAFLAVGVFIVALSSIFGWRRLFQPQGVVGLPPGATNHRRKSILLGKKPVLCDVWADLRAPEPSAGPPIGAGGHYRWEHILPMSASFIIPASSAKPQAPVDPISTTRPEVDPIAGHRITSRILRYFASAVRQYYPPVRPSRRRPSMSAPLASPPPPPPLVPMAGRSEVSGQSHLKTLATSHMSENALGEVDWGDASSVQVSVIVVMPTQRRPGYGSGSGTSGREAPSVSEGMSLELGEYCVGTMDVPWGEAG